MSKIGIRNRKQKNKRNSSILQYIKYIFCSSKKQQQVVNLLVNLNFDVKLFQQTFPLCLLTALVYS